MTINIVLTEQEARILEYALHFLSANLDEEDEEVLDLDPENGGNEIVALVTKLGFEDEPLPEEKIVDFGPPLDDDEDDHLDARLRFVETGGE